MPSARFQRTLRLTTTALRLEVDDKGRSIRTKRVAPEGQSWNDSDEGGWDDFDPLSDKGTKRTQPPARSERQRSDYNRGDDNGRDNRGDAKGRGRSDNRGDGRGRGRGDNRRGERVGGRSENRDEDSWGEQKRSEYRIPIENRRDDSGGRGGRGSDRTRQLREMRDPDDKRINMNALEGAGFVHLYGLASCLNALQADRRDFTRPEDMIDIESLTGEALEHEKRQRERKPEAQFSPFLFVQDRGGTTGDRVAQKAKVAEEVELLARERGIPVAMTDRSEERRVGKECRSRWSPYH